jgi:Flp pilus assembly protein TadB
MPAKKESVDDILKRYSGKIESQIKAAEVRPGDYSREYILFKREMAPQLTRYERLCRTLGSVVKLNVSESDEKKVRRHLEIAHLDIEPWQALTLSVMSFTAVFILGLLASLAIVLIQGNIASFPFLFFFLVIFVSVFLFYFVNGYPQRLANSWRLKASSQMVPAILYIVVYMRHTPNFEKAISFASQHLQYPLALDFKKVFYDVEIGRFSTLKDSLDNYLDIWKDYNIEFIESFHLIESSLFEPDNQRRIETLEKALQVILDGVYDKMLRFTHDARSPITNVYMLTTVLPVLGIALLPLASAMIGDYLRWYHVFVMYVLILPFISFFLTDKIIFLRPGGHGETDLLERNALYYKYKDNSHYLNAFLIALPLFIIGFLPLIFQYTFIPELFNMPKDFTYSQMGLGIFGDEKFFGFLPSASGSGVSGPFGTGALVLSMFIPLGVALFFSIAYERKTKELIVERDKTKQLEVEFNNSLFQLGNRIGNGMPPELAFGSVAQSSTGLITEEFFRKVNYNIRQNGMNVERAIFDQKRGAISSYPSELIATSMRVLVESSKKGLNIAAVSLMSISQYVKNIQKITERLRDMLAEIISDMKSNMTFLAPLLSGIVVGLAAMITSILTKISVSELGGQGAAGFGNFQGLLSVFEVSKMIPPYFLQIIIGIYLVEVVFILTNTLVVIDSGEDKLQRTSQTGKNLNRGMVLYFVTGLVSSLALFFLASIVIGGI